MSVMGHGFAVRLSLWEAAFLECRDDVPGLRY